MGGAVKAIKNAVNSTAGEYALRTVAGISSGGLSELSRDKPFQPGGKTSTLEKVSGGLGVASIGQQGGALPSNATISAGSGGTGRNAEGLGLGAQQTANVAVLDKETGGRIENFLNPRLPAIDTTALDITNKVKEAANAVQTAEAEARRARAAKRQSSVLGSYQSKQSINAATLTPNQPRRSVLG